MPNTEMEAEMAAQPFTDDDLRELVSVALAQKDARFRACAQAIVQVQAERDALRADAARLDWLTEMAASEAKIIGVAGVCYGSVYIGRKRIAEGDDIRLAIDAARDAGRARGETAGG